MEYQQSPVGPGFFYCAISKNPARFFNADHQPYVVVLSFSIPYVAILTVLGHTACARKKRIVA
jgi:hypothetical protein